MARTDRKLPFAIYNRKNTFVAVAWSEKAAKLAVSELGRYPGGVYRQLYTGKKRKETKQ